jgi:hypothetical protein
VVVYGHGRRANRGLDRAPSGRRRPTAPNACAASGRFLALRRAEGLHCPRWRRYKGLTMPWTLPVTRTAGGAVASPKSGEFAGSGKSGGFENSPRSRRATPIARRTSGTPEFEG